MTAFNQKCELLAPCGSIDALKAAVAGGADAVYFGLQKFNARIKADNFNDDNLPEWIDYCHFFNVKVYITLNIIIKEKELNEVIDMIKLCSKSRIDAFIVTDLAVISLIKEFAPLIPIHLSTQAGIHNLFGAKYAESLGVKRIVLSRETLFKDIDEIKKNTNIEIETFIHGAMCVSFSGNCYMSSIINSNSGNRGRCLQPCRLNYSFLNNVTVKKSGYLLSMADLASFEYIDKLKELGVTSFKIEGRLKRAEYVYYAVSLYRKILDGQPYTVKDLNKLKSAYNRGGYTKGYNYDDTKALMSVDVNNHIGLKWGSVIKVIDKNNYIVKTVKDLNIVIDEKTGVKFISKGNETGGGNLNKIIKLNDTTYQINVNSILNINDDIHITSLSEFNIKERKLPVKVIIRAKIGENLQLSAAYNDISVNKISDFIIEKSNNFNTDIQTELLKSVNIFDFSVVDSDIDDMLFIPLSVIKKTKISLINELKNKMLDSYNKNQYEDIHNNIQSINKIDNSEVLNKVNNLIAVEINNFEQINLIKDKADIIIVNSFDYSGKEIKNIVNEICKLNKEIYLKLPNIARADDLNIIRIIINDVKDKINGLFCDNLYAVQIADELNLKVFAGSMLNLVNHKSINSIKNLEYCLLSIELNKYEIEDLINKVNNNCFVYSYGFYPLMTLTHCPVKLSNESQCGSCSYNDNLFLQDRKVKFPIKRVKIAHCYFKVLNCVPHYLKKNDKSIYNRYYDFTSCDNDIIKQVLDDNYNPEYFTKGHYNSGVN